MRITRLFARRVVTDIYETEENMYLHIEEEHNTICIRQCQF